MDEEDLEGIDENDELYAVAPKRVRRLIGFDWASGYVSPFRPTDDACAHAIMLRAGVAAGSIVVDLGSGDGIVLIAAARQGAHAIGFELSSELNEAASRRVCEAGLEGKVEIHAQDLTQVDVVGVIERAAADASSTLNTSVMPKHLIVMYLLPEFLKKMEERVKEWLRHPLHPHLLVVTVRWPLAGLMAENSAHGAQQGYYVYTSKCVTSCPEDKQSAAKDIS